MLHFGPEEQYSVDDSTFALRTLTGLSWSAPGYCVLMLSMPDPKAWSRELGVSAKLLVPGTTCWTFARTSAC